MNTKIDDIIDAAYEAANPPHASIPTTRKVLRKLRATKNHKCALAFFVVLEGLRCQ